MDPNTFVNVLLLCLVNGFFVIAGVFLNSVVIVTLTRSSQLRKKLCYFMILVLSCFDLAVVIFFHSALILLAISLSGGVYRQYEDKFKDLSDVIRTNLGCFSMSALLVMSVERYLAVKYPFFHHTAVTKRRLLLFLILLMIIIVSVSPLLYFWKNTFGNVYAIVFISFFLFLLAYLNYNIFVIARSKRKADGRTVTASSHQERKGWKLNFRKFSTCSQAVGCFFIFSFPAIVYHVYVLNVTDAFPNKRLTQLFDLWTHTFIPMNSTFNCLIFFWKHSILRREGMKTVKHYLCARA